MGPTSKNPELSCIGVLEPRAPLVHRTAASGPETSIEPR